MRKLAMGMLAAVGVVAAAAAQISDGVVKIGVLTDMSGPYSDATGAGSLMSTRMAVEDFGGKVLGKPVEVVSADHQNKADIAANIARRWIDQEAVDVIIDLSNSAVALALQGIVLEKNRILINTGGVTADFTGKSCSPNGFSWVHDSYALASGAARLLTKQGRDSWFFVTVDYAFGHSLERDTSKFVTEAGGKVLGAVRHPLNTPDMTSFVQQAITAKPKVIGFANGGGDAINGVRQAVELGAVRDGITLIGLVFQIHDIHAIGLKSTQGVVVTDFGYWDLNDELRAWNQRFRARHGTPATYVQASDYSAINHYLKAVQAAGTDEAKAVAAKMKALPVNDFMSKDVKVREDGRVMRPAYIMQVKSPAESREEWDLYKLIGSLAPEESVRPLDQGGCPYVKG